MNVQLVASKFQITGKVLSVSPVGDGFINDTYLVETPIESPNYILQKKNKNIFKDVPAMMQNIQTVSNHVKEKVRIAGGDPSRQSMTVTLAHDGKSYYKDIKGNFWAMCQFIDNTVAYGSVDSPKIAYAGGKGIGQFQSQLADLTTPLTEILPGFHDLKFRFEQWDASVKADRAGRVSELAEEISWIESHRIEMMNFWKLIEVGFIPKRVTHNDTKISNILFTPEGDVLCVIDLDTVANSTVLNDFGDAIRSYANTGLEDDTNLENVELCLDTFKAFAEGYLSEATPFLNSHEIQWLAFSSRLITFEQVLRFLMDYIDGDVYYKIKSKDHNLVRARAQYKLLCSMERQRKEMKEFVQKTVREHPSFKARKENKVVRTYKELQD